MDAIRLVCPECDAVHRVKNITLGKLYRCKKCKSGLITMQPAVLTCPACGATRPPAHIEVSRLVTCDECEQMPLMNLRISGVTFSGDDLSANPEKPASDSTGTSTSAAPDFSETSTPAVNSLADNGDRDNAESAEKSAPVNAESADAPNLSAPLLAAPTAKPAKAEMITVVEPRFVEDTRPPSVSGIRNFQREADEAENKAQNRAAKNSESAVIKRPADSPTSRASTADTAAILPIPALSASANAAPSAEVIDRETPSRIAADFYDDTPPDTGASISAAPLWGKSLLNDVAELKTLLRSRKLSVFARPVFGWICLALLILLYGYALAVNTAQETQLQNVRRQLSQLAEQTQKDYDEMKDLLTQRIADLEKERTALRGEKVALENDLRDYYNKLNEAQRKVNLLNKAYSIGVGPGGVNER